MSDRQAAGGAVAKLPSQAADHFCQTEPGSFHRHRAHISAAHWRLLLSPAAFPKSSKGFLEVICLLDPLALRYHSHLPDGKTGHGVVNLLRRDHRGRQWPAHNHILDFCAAGHFCSPARQLCAGSLCSQHFFFLPES